MSDGTTPGDEPTGADQHHGGHQEPGAGAPDGRLAPDAVVDLSPEEAAVADALALLSGPALDHAGPRPPAGELEEAWGPEATDALAALRADLDGRRVGLAISGGGSLGSFEAGALRFVYDHARVQPVAVTGNSAGALNAAKLAHGDGPDGEPVIDDLERLWRSMRINPDMWEPEPWLTRVLASASWASAIRGKVGGTTNAASAIRVAIKVMGSIVRRPEETDGTFDAIRDGVKAQSLLSLAPVAELIAAELDPERVRSSGIKLRMGTVSLESGELRYVTETGHLHDRDDRPLDHPPVSLADGILASASIPVAFPPVLLGEEHYVDGGAREILPLEILVEHLGVDRAIAISAASPEIDRTASFADRSILDIIRRVSAEIATNETLRKELKPPGGWGSHVRLVIPEIDVHDAMTIDPALIAISYDYGWMRAADQLLGLDHRAASLGTELTRTRIALRELAGPLPTLFGSDPTTALLDQADEPPADPPAWVDGKDTLTARLREQTRARRELGAPLPHNLLAWLDETDRPATAPTPG